MSQNIDLSRWDWRINQNPEAGQALSKIVSRFDGNSSITIAGRNNIEDVLDILDNRDVDTKFIVSLGNIPPNAIDGVPNQPSVVARVYPDYASYEGHQKAVDLMHILTGLDKADISSEYPGLGFTGTEDKTILQGIAYANSFPAFLNGTVVHDVLVTLSEDFGAYGLKGIDGGVYGTTNKALSALYMALDTMTLNLVSAITTGDLSLLVPEEEEFLNFIGFNQPPKEEITLFNTVTNLGKTASTIGAKLTINGKLYSLEIRDLYTRF